MTPSAAARTDLAQQIRAAILARGLTQAELSALAGVPQSRISDFLAGKDMRLRHATAICRALGLTLRAI